MCSEPNPPEDVRMDPEKEFGALLLKACYVLGEGFHIKKYGATWVQRAFLGLKHEPYEHINGANASILQRVDMARDNKQFQLCFKSSFLLLCRWKT